MSASQHEVVVYSPPVDGLPFLVVTLMPDGTVSVEPFTNYGLALARFQEVAAELHKAHGSSEA